MDYIDLGDVLVKIFVLIYPTLILRFDLWMYCSEVITFLQVYRDFVHKEGISASDVSNNFFAFCFKKKELVSGFTMIVLFFELRRLIETFQSFPNYYCVIH